MYDIVNKTQFMSRFRDIRPENFSTAGLSALFDWMEEMEECTGKELEFDPIALCCDFGEYTEDEIRREFDHVDGISDADDLDELAVILNEETIVLETGNDTLVLGAF